MPTRDPHDPRSRVVVRAITPDTERGRFAVKRTPDEPVVVEADVFTDGHDHVRAVCRYRANGADGWDEVELDPLGLPADRHRGTFRLDAMGWYDWQVVAWVDRFDTWRDGLAKKAAAGVDVDVHLRSGAVLAREFAEHAVPADRTALVAVADTLDDGDGDGDLDARVAAGLNDDLATAMRAADPRRFATHAPMAEVDVAPARARFSTWYELFPRSASPDPDRHGTLRDVIDRLPYVASMGFDVLYLPPVHPIGRTARKGPNNAVVSEPGDLGSPWAIGAAEGGHTDVHPDLGTVDDLVELATVARDEHGIELALDIALQCAPDHPWVSEHPEWFGVRPDGTIQYAENPPKKYEDIVPFDFETPDHEALWQALKDVFDTWIGRGVKTFRVDNPHTKSFRFWEWCLRELRAEHGHDLVFLSEAFSRMNVKTELARRGFSQGYTYFTWKQQKWELEQYVGEIVHGPASQVFRPNYWPNTPDILTEQLQQGSRPIFVQRLVLAATLGANFGMYGPTYELLEHRAAKPGSEEYLDSEKYQQRTWDLDAEHSIRDIVSRVNQIRHEHPALQSDRTLTFHHVEHDQLVAYSKRDPATGDCILVVVNLDTEWTHGATLWADLGELGIDGSRPWRVHDLLDDTHYLWHGSGNYVELDPHHRPAHVLHVRQDAHHPHETFHG